MARLTTTAPLFAILLCPLAPAPVAAQEGDPAAAPTDAIHVNIARVKQRLESQDDDAPNYILQLEYQLSVYGDLPEIDPFAGFDIRHGPVPFGVPTHQDLMRSWTPGEFRSETIPLMPLLRWTFDR